MPQCTAGVARLISTKNLKKILFIGVENLEERERVGLKLESGKCDG